MKVGFIGLGNMGGPMALNLIDAGFELTVCDLDEAKARPHRAAGALWADSPRACAQAGETVVTSLFGPAQIERLANAPDGLLAGLGPGKCWIDMTTNDPKLVRALADACAERGASLLEAPVTGAVDGARAGRLTIFVGGEARLLARQRPVLEAMGAVIHAGGLGAGNVVKLITNMLWFIHAAAFGEALALGAKAGVETRVLWEAIKSGAADSFVARHDAPSIFAGHYDPSFTLDLCLKDLGLIDDLARDLEVPAELARLARGLFERARERYGGEAGELFVARRLEDDLGVSFRLPGDWPAPWEQ